MKYKCNLLMIYKKTVCHYTTQFTRSNGLEAQMVSCRVQSVHCSISWSTVTDWANNKQCCCTSELDLIHYSLIGPNIFLSSPHLLICIALNISLLSISVYVHTHRILISVICSRDNVVLYNELYSNLYGVMWVVNLKLQQFLVYSLKEGMLQR